MSAHEGDERTDPRADEREDHELGEAAQRRVQRRRGRNVTLGTVVLVALMGLVVLDGLGVVDAFGVDDSTATAESGPVRLSVQHTDVARPGLAAPLSITVEQDGGFPGEVVTISIDDDYLAIWDFNGIVPAPSAETADGERVTWEFDAPDGEVLTVRLDARIEPARQEDAHARIAVLDGDGRELVGVDIDTAVRP